MGQRVHRYSVKFNRASSPRMCGLCGRHIELRIGMVLAVQGLTEPSWHPICHHCGSVAAPDTTENLLMIHNGRTWDGLARYYTASEVLG